MNSRLRLVYLPILAAAMAVAASSGAEVVTRIDCPGQIVYRFQFFDGKLAAEADPVWSVQVRRGEGERTVGLPQLYTRSEELICEYHLPNGSFALVTRPRPSGTTCTAGADDVLSIPYFRCE